MSVEIDLANVVNAAKAVGDAEGYARGVAEERARCLREVAAERERWSSQAALDALFLVIQRISAG